MKKHSASVDRLLYEIDLNRYISAGSFDLRQLPDIEPGQFRYGIERPGIGDGAGPAEALLRQIIDRKVAELIGLATRCEGSRFTLRVTITALTLENAE